MYRGNDGTTNENNRSTTARIGNRPDRTCKARTPDKNRGYVYTVNNNDANKITNYLLIILLVYRTDEKWWRLRNFEEHADLIDFIDWLENRYQEAEA